MNYDDYATVLELNHYIKQLDNEVVFITNDKLNLIITKHCVYRFPLTFSRM